MSADIYIVDVCGTLVGEDTTLGLLHYHFANASTRKWRYCALLALTHKRSPIRLCFAALEKLTRRHWLKHAAVLLLTGERVALLDASASQYAQHLLAQRRLAVVSALLEGVKAPQLLLASASLQPIVAALANALGCAYVASELASQAGVLTGRFATDLTAQKPQALMAKYPHHLQNRRLCVISDNLSDRALLNMATQRVVVLTDEKQRRRWAGLNATYLLAKKS